VANAFQEVYKAPLDQQELLNERALQLHIQTQTENHKFGEEVKAVAEQLQGTEMACEVVTALGSTVDKMIFATVCRRPVCKYRSYSAVYAV
jgi:hypothetical protein